MRRPWVVSSEAYVTGSETVSIKRRLQQAARPETPPRPGTHRVVIASLQRGSGLMKSSEGCRKDRTSVGLGSSGSHSACLDALFCVRLQIRTARTRLSIRTLLRHQNVDFSELPHYLTASVQRLGLDYNKRLGFHSPPDVGANAPVFTALGDTRSTALDPPCSSESVDSDSPRVACSGGRLCNYTKWSAL